MAKFRILLLTNRDSDNVGDQIIEATAVSIIKGIMANLGVPTSDYAISSRAAGIISRKYMSSGDPALLAPARAAISAADVIVFGGAPLFNYSYQSFYLRTIRTLELAEEYNVPVLFSSIGVEPYDPTNPKSVALKEALSLSCVRQITTRDDFASLQKYVEGTEIPVAHVSDPAVFADVVFGEAKSGLAGRPGARRKVGLVVTRAGIFKDNGIAFTKGEQQKFWLDVIDLLTERGFDYKLFTTGHFTDEAFLDELVKVKGVPQSNAAITVNSQEELVDELSACDGVIAYRLHASITAFAYGIPSIGLSWNFKVPYFYESVGHGDRALGREHWNATDVVGALEKAMAAGVTKDEDFLTSVYSTLFAGLKAIVAPGSDPEPYTYGELREKLPRYPGTTPAQYQEKMRNKLRRIYDTLNARGPKKKAVKRSLPRRVLGKVKRVLRPAR
ncbi:polysaccharide pyruvyl transferase family protein [Cellulomonas sp. PhB150]|uniref:polysaccharide pyruvyl transferase family protein n=1 Tax=Cellulomonas sp. PhB150 TaxID=2485188 RepID=UPI000FB8F7F2|nr:polysaccharide pyruvyl transferase family protein [Cellulomonas sp. PhB150]ROS31228.1 polysaccharide pyruvyl transferase WcaK-like protein [Cellulomonas sp. PhB150]